MNIMWLSTNKFQCSAPEDISVRFSFWGTAGDGYRSQKARENCPPTQTRKKRPIWLHFSCLFCAWKHGWRIGRVFRVFRGLLYEYPLSLSPPPPKHEKCGQVSFSFLSTRGRPQTAISFVKFNHQCRPPLSMCIYYNRENKQHSGIQS